MKKYSVEQFDDLIFKGFQYTLPPTVLTNIMNLEKWLKAPDGGGTTSTGSAAPRRRQPNPTGKREVTWRPPNEPFKVTQFIAKEKTDREQFLQQIRLQLNKVSANNFDALNEIMMAALEEQWGDGETDDFAALVQPLLDIASMNKFYAEIYARLFQAWSHKFPVEMSQILATLCAEQHESMASCGEGYADERKDPEKYYAYGKMNDKRRANTVFWVHLWKCGVIPVDEILTKLAMYHDWLWAWIDEAGRGPAVEELADNMCLAVTLCKTDLSTNAQWMDSVWPKVQRLAQSKSKDHVCLPSRIVFKYKDL